MDLLRRFVFRAHASAIGGRMYRPTDCLLTSPASAALSAAGGLSEARAKRVRCRPYLSAGEVITRVEGGFDDRAQAVAWTHGLVDEDAMSTTTTAFCSVRDLVVGRKRLTVKRLEAGLVSQSAGGSSESSIRLASTTIVEGVAIDGYPLVVTLNRIPFETLDTLSKLRAAAADSAFAKKHGGCFLMTTPIAGRRPPVQPRLADEGGTILATIAGSVQWKRRPHPKARIDGHVVIVPDFGRIHFGEMFITGHSRRLTLMRLQLGSPEGGTGTVTEVETNGSWYPPTS
jgi:hypothetical protein